MPNTPNASFIPKQSPAKRSRYVASRQLHLLTLVSYVLFIATLIASAGLFFYTRYLNSKLTSEVEALNADIAGFNESDMDQVREFNYRLQQANQRLSNSVSLKSIFAALEQATAQSVQVVDFSLKRNNDSDYEISAKLETDSFDSTLFQRSLFEGNSVMNSVNVSDLLITTSEDGANGVTFTAKIGVPLASVPYEAVDTPAIDSDFNPSASSSSSSAAVISSVN